MSLKKKHLHCTSVKENMQLNSWHYRMNIFHSISFIWQKFEKLSHLVPPSPTVCLVEFVQPGRTLNFEVYYQQLYRLKQTFDQKQLELANRELISTKTTSDHKLRDLGWEILMHPPKTVPERGRCKSSPIPVFYQ